MAGKGIPLKWPEQKRERMKKEEDELLCFALLSSLHRSPS